jgi:surface polysaccharide O-acyltransferase-like enzyme
MGNHTRIFGFDYLRVLASFSVVIIHACYMNKTIEGFNIYNSYAVPVFILMSIYLISFNNASSKNDKILKLLKRIAPQYIFWTLIYLSLRYIKARMSGNTIEIDFSTIFLGGSAVQLWFLPAIFIWQIIMLYFQNYKNFIVDIIIASVLFVLGRYLMANDYLEIGFQNTFAIYSGYIFIAKLIKQYQNEIEKIPYWSFYLLLAILICFKSFNSFYILDVLYSVIVFLIFLRLSIKPGRIITSLSDNSFGIYLIHFLFIQVIVFVYQKSQINFTMLTTLVSIVLSFLFSYLVSFIFSKNQYLKKIV